MRTALLLLAFVGTSSLLACSFQMHAGTDPQRPRGYGRRTTGPTGPTPAPTTTTTAPVPAPAAPPGAMVTRTILFGAGTVDASGYRGAVYWVPTETTTLPTLTSMTPTGYLYAHDLNIPPQTFSGGFPGLDSSHNSHFAIRYEAPLVVATEADYDFRVVADDGAILRIDNTVIVDNDGVKTAAASKEGPVHLVAGTHTITVDYFQATGPVALQVYCKRFGDVERICPTSL